MSDALTFTYTPEQNDYAQVLRIFFLRQTGIRVSLGFLVVAFIYILYTIARQSTPVSAFEILWLLLPPLFVVYILYFQPRSMAKRAIATQQLAAETTWEVNDQGIKISTEAPASITDAGQEENPAESRATLLEWDNLKNLITAKEYFLLVFKTERNFFRFLPRRAIKSPGEQEQFLNFVKSHLNKSA